MADSSTTGKTYIVEHLDPELGPWSELEYIAIADESQQNGSSFTLSSISPDFKVPSALQAIPKFTATQDSVEDIYAASKDTVCLLDPSADKDLSPQDAKEFSVFLFGGILGEIGRIPSPEPRNMMSSCMVLTATQVMIPPEVNLLPILTNGRLWPT